MHETTELTPVQRFWQDPTQVPEEIGPVPEDYRRACEPESLLVLNRVTRYLCEIVRAYRPPPASVLELGCGTGRNLALLHEMGYYVTGIEINPHAKQLARQHFMQVSERIQVGPVEDLLPRTRPHDLVLTQNFLMHLPYERNDVFGMMREKAGQYILTNEVEDGKLRSSLRFPRLVSDFVAFGRQDWRQVAHLEQLQVPGIVRSVTRVFRHEP